MSAVNESSLPNLAVNESSLPKSAVKQPRSLFMETLVNRLTPKRRNSWSAVTPECAKNLEWSPRIDYRTPRTRRRWEASPLRGSPARRLYSWSWEDQFVQEIEPSFEKVPLTDLNSRTTYMLDVDDYERLPPLL